MVTEAAADSVSKSQRKRIAAQTAREPGHYLRHIGPHAVADTWLPSGAWASGDNDEQTTVEPLFLAGEQPPELGWTTPAKLLSWHDADTATVSVTKIFNIRLKDCWAPEVGKRLGTKTVSEAERRRGQEARNAAIKLMPENSDCLLQIPTHLIIDAMVSEPDASFSRLVGRIFTPQGQNIGQRLIELGHATKTKTKEG